MRTPTHLEKTRFLSPSSDSLQQVLNGQPLQERRSKPRPAKNSDSDAQRAAQGGSILLVDDSPFERTVIRSAVEGLTEFQVCGEAADGVEGIEKALELKPDLIIISINAHISCSRSNLTFSFPSLFFFLIIRRPPRSTLFPYTTLSSRSGH